MNIKKKYFSIIIPTMWKSDKIHQMLDVYQKNDLVKEIIIIDNYPSEKPNLEKYNKIIYYTEGKNLYVNPSWNIGVSLSGYQIILANDDILIRDLTKILGTFKSTDFDIIGTQLGELNEDYNISPITDFPENSFGVFMYIRNYTYIPEQIKIWFGDNILFDNNKKRGILKNAGIVVNDGEQIPKINGSVTVKYIRNINGDDIIKNDRIYYNKLKNDKENFNIIVRTSGRKNYFKRCINSIKKFYPTAKVHVTLDDETDLKYVEENMVNMDWTYYLINKKTITNITNKIKLNREIKFIYNYYFNIVKPFLKGWVMYLDDDDQMVRTPEFDWGKKDTINLYRADLKSKIVPSSQNFGKKPVLNDISTLCVIVHSNNLIDWVPNRGGDYDFINELYSKNKVIWFDTINSKIQNIEGYGNRKDIDITINGFYLNLERRQDRRIKMETELKKTTHNIQRYKAIDGTELKSLNGFSASIRNSESKQYATYLSHLNMIKIAKQNGWNKVMILEDDITLCDDFDERIELYLSQLPSDWEIAYIGFTEISKTNLTKVTEYVHRVKEVYGCWGMIINSSMYDKLLRIGGEKNTVIDWVIKDYIQPNYGCYVFMPFLAYVNDDYSDLWNTHRKLGMIKKYFKNRLIEDDIESQEEFIPQETNLEKLKKLMNLTERKKVEINYENINNALSKKENFYKTNSSLKPLRENIPQNRNEITLLKKDSLTKTSRDLFSKGKKYKG